MQSEDSTQSLSEECDNSSFEQPKRRKGGRPKGSKTKRHDEVEVLLPQCRKCGSTDLLADDRVREMEYYGTHEGRLFNRIKWTKYKCRACKQAQVHKTWHNV